MSVEKVARESGVVWRVRWRQDGRNRAKTFSTYKDARTFDGDVHRRKRLDDLAALDAGKETLAEFAGEWWELHAVTLAKATQEAYATILDVHILTRLGSLRLRALDFDWGPDAIAELLKLRHGNDAEDRINGGV